MYSAFPYQVAQARVADTHSQARHDALVHEAREARRVNKRSSRHRVPKLPVISARRVLAAWGVRT